MSFIILYRFNPARTPGHSIQGTNSDIEIKGVFYKNVNEEYWTLPRQVGEQNQTEGFMYD